jgi:sulfur-oxidizing protein SoxZ
MSADIGRIRIRVPAIITPGEVVRARVLVIHPMEIVERRDGKPVDRSYNFVNRMIVSYLGREILQVETTQSISENPVFGFAFRASAAGPLRVTFLDTQGGTYEATTDLKLG